MSYSTSGHATSLARALPGLTSATHYQARCSCGWTGVWRTSPDRANRSAAAHIRKENELAAFKAKINQLQKGTANDYQAQ